jgi:DNA-binding response OmpR family regulator
MSSSGSPVSFISASAPLPTIVVATREPAIGRVIVMALRLEGYAPHLFEDGEQAQEATLGVPCVAAVLDALLPKVSGLTICQSVRATASIASLPIIVLMMRDEATLRARAQRVGASACLLMPFAVQELLAAVAAVLSFVPPPLDGRIE